MADHFGHPGGAGGKVDQHHIPGGDGGVGHKVGGALRQGGGVIQPALPGGGGVHQGLAQQAAAAFFQRLLALGDDPVVRKGDEEPHLCGLHPVGDVLGRQLVGGGDNHRPDAVEGHRCHPVLPPALQQAHHPVPLSDPLGQQVGGGPAGKQGDLPKGKAEVMAVVVAPLQRSLAGVLRGPGVHHVGGKVKVRRAAQAVIFFEILIGIKLGPGQESFQHILQRSLSSLGLGKNNSALLLQQDASIIGCAVPPDFARPSAARTLPERREHSLDSVPRITLGLRRSLLRAKCPGWVRDSEATSPGTGRGVPSSSRSLCPGGSGVLLLFAVFG